MFAPAAETITLRFIWDQYKKVRKLEVNTIKDYEKRLKIVSDWLDLPITSITKADVLNRYMSMVGSSIDEVSSPGCKPSVAQANYAFKVLRALFEYSTVLYEIPTTNPVKVLKAVKAWRTLSSREDIIDDKNLPKWFAKVIEFRTENQRLSDWLLLTIFTGLRKMEGLELSWREVNLDQRIIRLPSEDEQKPRRTKNGKEHKLPLGDYTYQLLKNRYENREHELWVFPGDDGKPLSDYYQGYKLITEGSKPIEGCGIVFTPHTLRRTFATAAENADLSARNIQRLMNHTPKTVTDLYKITQLERLREPMQMVEDCLLGLGKVEFMLGKESSNSEPT